MPLTPSVRPAAIRLEAAPRSSGVRTMEWNSSTGNRKKYTRLSTGPHTLRLRAV